MLGPTRVVFRFGMVHGITGRLPVGYDTVATHGQPQSHEVSRPGDYITEVHRMWDEQQLFSKSFIETLNGILKARVGPMLRSDV